MVHATAGPGVTPAAAGGARGAEEPRKSRRLPVSIIAGFLGSGKTTLLNGVLSADGGLRCAVLVNDFGAIDVDAQLVRSSTQNVLSLKNGCICCSMQSDLVSDVLNITKRFGPSIDGLLIECSGVSEPARIVHALRYPVLRCAVEVDTVLTVVDPVQFAALEGPLGALAISQLEAADIVVLNKLDLASADQVQSFRRNWQLPGARLVTTTFGRIPPALVFSAATDAGADRPPGGRAASPPAHGLNLVSWVWQSSAAVERAALEEGLRGLSPRVLRGKGFVDLVECPDHRCLVQLVGDRIELSPDTPWADRPRASRLVFIGDHLQRRDLGAFAPDASRATETRGKRSLMPQE